MRICFALGPLAGLAAVALSAASLPDSGRAVKSVVRADANGRLVRSVVVSPRAVRENVIPPKIVPSGLPQAEPEPQAAAAPASTFREAVDEIARKHDLPPQLVHSVIRVESNYDPYAVSPKGALGLMQLVPGTARRFGVSNVFNPAENIEGGARYLRYLLDLYHNDYRLALAAYNAGEGAVAKHGGVPPYPETVNYLQQVRRRLVEASQQQAAKKLEAKPVAVKAAEETRIVEIVEPNGRVHYVSK
jgi:soluble lytic murein transglycosylase-like protein